MLIALEGADGSGKSTIANKVHDLMPGSVLTHFGAPKSPDTALSECIDDEPVGGYVVGTGQNIICDRLHWGSPTYGPILRPDIDEDGYGDIGKAGWRYAELYIASRGGVTVYVDVGVKTAQDRILARGDDNYPVDMLVRITPELLDRYHWLLADAPTLGLHLYEPALADLDSYAYDIVCLASEREAAVLSTATSHQDYVGLPHPKTLVICEPTKDARLEILGELSDDEWAETGFCSSMDSRESLRDLAQKLAYPNIVGVGKLPNDADAFVFEMSGNIVESFSGSINH